MMTTIIAILVMAGITLLLAGALVLANKKLFVFEDPRVDIVEELLPHTNCGACGFPGCRSFAEALVGGKTQPAKCTVSSPEGLVAIADYLGVEAGTQEKIVARLACAGGINVARMKARYTGMQTCRAAALISGGGKGCWWGCLGFGDCEVVCDFDAMEMNSWSLPVVIEDKCTACGDCVEICPKDLFTLHPASHRLWVACKSEEAGDEILEECEVACTACARCAMDAKDGTITMQNNLPVIDYSKDHNTKAPIQRCPTGAIVWIEPDGEVVMGRESKKVLRKSPRPVAAT